MDLTRVNVLLQLINLVFYSNDFPSVPLTLIGFWNHKDQIQIAERMFEKGVPTTVLQQNRVKENDEILKVLERDFQSKILIDFDAITDKELFQEIGGRKLFSTKREYLIIGRDLAEFKKSIEFVAVFLNSRIRFAEIINITTVLIYSVRNPAQPFGGKFLYCLEKELEVESVDGALEVVRENLCREEHLDWSTVILPVGIVSLKCENNSLVDDNFMQWFESEDEPTRDATPRFGYSLFRVIQNVFKFKLSIVCAQYWSVSSNSGGAVGDLVRGATVISTAPMLGLETRRELLEIIHPLTSIHTAFIFQTPSQGDFSGLSFMKPFSINLWICLICSVILVGIAIKMAIKVEIRTSLQEENYHFEPSFALTMLNSVGVLSQQGMHLQLKWNSSRILQIVFFLCGCVLYNYYNSLVVAELISFPKPTELNSLKALGESNLELGAQNISYLHYYMKESDQQHVRNLYKKLTSQKSPFYSPVEGTAKARRPGFAYHCETQVTLHEMQRTYGFYELCNYHLISLIKAPLYAFCTKHSPLTEFFKIQYMRTLEFGIGSKTDITFGVPKIACLSNALIEQVDIQYVAPILIFLLYAVLVSLFILVVEIAWEKFRI